MQDNAHQVFLDDAIFGRGSHQARIWPDGYDWVGSIEERKDRLGVASGRLLAVVRDAYQDAPQNSLISEFDQQLKEEVSKRTYVSELDVEFFLDRLKSDIVGSLPGMPGVGHEYDTSALLEVYGNISRRFPEFDIRPTLVERVRNVLSPNPAPAPEDVYEAVVASVSTHLNAAEEEVVEIGSERMAAFGRMIDAIADKIDTDDVGFAEQINEVRQRIEGSAELINSTVHAM